MTDAIAHRGPDGEGLFLESEVALGHRRLAIIDTSNLGHQPMSSRDGEYVLTYNGEIYNFKEIRAELTSLGHKFVSNTDTEVVLNAWIQWGEGSVRRLNGMFAFAIWERAKRTLSLVRDRYGIKPLYYALSRDVFVFSSEQRGIAASGHISNDLDCDALFEYLTFQNILSDRTLRRDVRLLPPATIMRVDLRNTQITTENYWRFNFSTENNPTRDAEEYEEELDRLLRQAVERQLISDVELGSYLSGGMDSGSLTAIASDRYRGLKSFTCGFDLHDVTSVESGFDERRVAEGLSRKFETEHYEIVLKHSDMERYLSQVVLQIEEPRVGQSYPNFLVARLASKYVKVVLSGSGGDELFGGYPWRYGLINDCTSHSDFLNRYFDYWRRLATPDELMLLFAPSISQLDVNRPRRIFDQFFVDEDDQTSRPEDLLNQCLGFESRTFLHGLLLVEDKLSMAHGLESRVPFLDNDLVEFAQSCPGSFKIGTLASPDWFTGSMGNSISSMSTSSEGKLILRKVMRRLLPDDIALGKKQGFSSPDESWFRHQSRDFVLDRLGRKDSALFEILDYRTVQSMLQEHLAGRANRRLLIWSLLSLESIISDNS